MPSETVKSWTEQQRELAAEIDVRRRLQPLRDSIVKQSEQPQRVTEGYDPAAYGVGPIVRRPVGFYEDISLEPWVTPDVASNRRDGHYTPVFQSESELQVIRGVARALGDGDEAAVGVLENLCNYVVHTGFTYSVNCEKSTSLELLQAEAQRCIDEFIEANSWEMDFEQELFKSSVTDGELIVALDVDGCNIRARHVEPSWMTEPLDPKQLEDQVRVKMRVPHAIDWRYGVATRKGDATDVYGYFVAWNGCGEEWNFYPPSRFLHLKRNVPRHVKRGLTDFYPVSGRIVGATELLTRMGTGAGIQASIALIVKNATGGGGSIESLTDAGGANSKPIGVTDYRNGEVIDTFGREFQAGPMAGTQAANFVQVLQAMRRATGVRWSMPEHMISGDASNNNYASILEAGAPFTRAVEAGQQRLTTSYEKLLWRVLRIYFELGRFNRFGFGWPQIRQLLNVMVEATSPAVTDKEKELRVADGLRLAGVMSRRTMASRFDLDYDEERDNAASDSPSRPDSGQQIQPSGQPPADMNAKQDSIPVANELPGATPEDAKLNGAQITAAIGVLAGVTAGDTADVVAIELLQALAIDEERAKRMVIASKNVPNKIDAEKKSEARVAAKEALRLYHTGKEVRE